jgi:dimethylargininase
MSTSSTSGKDHPSAPSVYLDVIAREPCSSMQNCELTCIEREPINIDRVREQHDRYLQTILEAGRSKGEGEGGSINLILLPRLEEYQDSMFVEDVAVIFPDCALITHPGAKSRRGEVDAIVEAVHRVRPAPAYKVHRISSPGATLEGGDILVVGKFVFAGNTTRTNPEGFNEMDHFLKPFGYQCFHIKVTQCLHLKSAASKLDEETVLINPEWIDAKHFTQLGLSVVEVDPKTEPGSANVLSFKPSSNRRIIFVPEAFPNTRATIEKWATQRNLAKVKASSGEVEEHISVVSLAVDEIAKAEGALTCCSLLAYRSP